MNIILVTIAVLLAAIVCQLWAIGRVLNKSHRAHRQACEDAGRVLWRLRLISQPVSREEARSDMFTAEKAEWLTERGNIHRCLR